MTRRPVAAMMNFTAVMLTAVALAAVVLLGEHAAPLAAQAQGPADPSQTGPARAPDVIFVPTPQEVVEAMLTLAQVGPTDVIYDLGSGDGRIPIAAARLHGARGVGIDINPERTREAIANARAAGVADKVRFVTQDLFTADLREATVVTLYLLPALNRRLIPKLNAELKPGTRIVSHAFDMGDIPPIRRVEVNGRLLYFWQAPLVTRPR